MFEDSTNQLKREDTSYATKRNLDHLEYDDNLYDFMKSLIPFSLATSNKSVNNFLLGGFGLEKEQYLNLYFNDTVGKRELVQELLLGAILPREWSQDDAADGPEKNTEG